jgi:hypothetical protein
MKRGRCTAGPVGARALRVWRDASRFARPRPGALADGSSAVTRCCVREGEVVAHRTTEHTPLA